MHQYFDAIQTCAIEDRNKLTNLRGWWKTADMRSVAVQTGAILMRTTMNNQQIGEIQESVKAAEKQLQESLAAADHALSRIIDLMQEADVARRKASV